MKTRIAILMFTLLFITLGVVACSSLASPAASPTVTIVRVQPTAEPVSAGTPTSVPATKPVTSTYSDPFAYCAAVGAVDAPDARYDGPQTPDPVVRGLMKAMGMAADAPVDPFARLTKWRCMSAKVYACNLGANIPCDEKADTNRTPTAAMNDYCNANPSAVIPAVVTGRATVFDWKCTGGKPQIVKELTQPDARGFLAMFWYEVAPSSSRLQLTKQDNNKSFELGKGGALEVVLEGNPGSTGYSWVLESGNAAVLKQQGESSFEADASKLGAPGKFTFKFAAAGAGAAQLKFANKRPWEPNDPNVEKFNVTVNVK